MAGREEAEALAGTGRGGCEVGSWGKGGTGGAPGPTKVSASNPKEVTNGWKC